MPLPTKHNLEQIKRLRDMTRGKDIGDIVEKGEKKKEGDMPNAYWIDNPLDRVVDTYESFIKNDNKLKMEDVKDILKESVYNRGKGPGNDDYFMNSFKQILTSQISPSILQIGKYVNVGNIEGYIDSVDNNYVYISSTKGDGVKEKVSFKDFLKKIKLEGKINENSGFPSEYWTTNPERYGENDDPDVETIEIDPETEEDGDDEGYQETREDDDDDEGYQETQKNDDDDDEDDEDEEEVEVNPNEEEEEVQVQPGESEDIGGVGVLFGTEDNPRGVIKENIYNNDFKGVVCDDCGEVVEDTYRAKVAHIYNKHFNKPEMDGSVPQKTNFPGALSWPQGGRETLKLVRKYFPNSSM